MEILKVTFSFLDALIGSFFILFMLPFALLSGYRSVGLVLCGIGAVLLAIAYQLHISLVLLLILLTLNGLGFLALFVWSVSVTRRLPHASHMTVAGVTTLKDAVFAC